MPTYSSRVVYSLLFFLLATALLLVIRPASMFDEEGNAKPFGIGPGKTLFSLGMAIVIIAILAFYICSLVGMISTCSASTRIRQHLRQETPASPPPPAAAYFASPPPSAAALANPPPPPLLPAITPQPFGGYHGVDYGAPPHLTMTSLPAPTPVTSVPPPPPPPLYNTASSSPMTMYSPAPAHPPLPQPPPLLEPLPPSPFEATKVE